MTLFVTAICLILVSAFLAPCTRKGSTFWDTCSLACGLGGTLLGLVATLVALAHPDGAILSHPWPGVGGLFVLRLDGLAAVFLLPAFLICGAGLLYGSGYWPCQDKPASSAWLRFFYPLLGAAMALVLTAGNGLVFLFAWETMALCGYFLIMTERDQEEVHAAGFLYLAATHTATLALFALFALLGDHAVLNTLPAVGSLDGTTPLAATLFLLALFGFGFKAGIMPLHIWLPKAHAAAPSHVSALLSGVMIKMGIYGLVRTASFFHGIPNWWGWTILVLGMLSSILGVVFAIAQHDIKRLLAYHSVENIGIILLGLGVALLGRSYGVAAMVVLGLAGALLHVINHGLFKALLFLSAGSVIHATGTRELNRYGGLLRPMPLTGLCFLGGAIAICGLPPLNGFVSEWLIYLGLFQGSQPLAASLPSVLLAAPALALTGGLALLCFAKVFGLTFLGTPRSELGAAHEAPRTMLIGMGVLLAACLAIGLLPGMVYPLLRAATLAWLPTAAPPAIALAALAPAGSITLAALLLLLLLGFFTLKLRPRQAFPSVPTWSCGYACPLPRAQYTASSFAELITGLFGWFLRPQTQEVKPQGEFPVQARFATHIPDLVLDLGITPFCSLLATAAAWLRHRLQHGIVGLYLLYPALTLCILLILAL